MDASLKSGAPRELMWLAGINFLGFFGCMAWDRYYLGMWVAGVLHPSFIIASGIMIGYNFAFLILRHSLKMHLSDR